MLIALSVVAISLGATSTAGATTLQLKHKPFKQMTRTQVVKFLKRQRFHDKSILRFARNHPTVQTVELRKAVRWARVSLRIVQRNLHKLTAVVSRRVTGNVSGLLCIHHYEGAWNDPGSPYWGGLQMDLSFQQAYGPEFLRRWGTADHWPVWAQLQAGLRAVAVRGYSPWPNTARLCGLY